MSDVRLCRVPGCRTLIRFVTDIESQKTIAIDALPSPNGTIAVIPPNKCQQFSPTDVQRLAEERKPLHSNHNDTCADPSWFKAQRDTSKQNDRAIKHRARGASRHKRSA
jgi:hypothetical protein